MNKRKIKVMKNIWGNYVCFIGSARVIDFGVEWDARDWLSEQLESGEFVLSAKSDISMGDVEAHRARLAAPICRSH